MTYASCVSSGLREAAQTRESIVLFQYEKRREAMEKLMASEPQDVTYSGFASIWNVRLSLLTGSIYSRAATWK